MFCGKELSGNKRKNLLEEIEESKKDIERLVILENNLAIKYFE